MFSKSKDSLQLLLTLGYSPKWLSKTVSQKWIPVYITIVLSALLITGLFQFSFQHYVMEGREELSPLLHWIVIAAAAILLTLSILTNYSLVKKLLIKL